MFKGPYPMNDNISSEAEEMFERALQIAEKHLDGAMKESGDLSDYVAVAMIEAAVNKAVEATSGSDIVDVLRDMADQIEADDDGSDDASDEDDEDEDEGE